MTRNEGRAPTRGRYIPIHEWRESMAKKRQPNHSEETKAKAVSMYKDEISKGLSKTKAAEAVAAACGCSTWSVRMWAGDINSGDRKSRSAGKYPHAIRTGAVAEFHACRAAFGSDREAAKHVAGGKRYSPDSLLNWVHADAGNGARPVVPAANDSPDETHLREQLAHLVRQIEALRRKNTALTAALKVFLDEDAP